MKIAKTLLTLTFFIILATLPVLHASSTLTIALETSQPLYYAGQTVHVYGNLTSNGSAVQLVPIALEVQDPNGTTIVVRTLLTDTTGTYNLTFKLPSGAMGGNYTVYVSSAYMEQNATNSATFEFIAILGDVNGDGVVDIYDVVTVATAFGSYPGHQKWNPDADLVPDSIIDIYDIVTVAMNFGKTL